MLALRFALLGSGFAALASGGRADDNVAALRFHNDVQPFLAKYCSDCHFNGVEKGNVAFDEFKSDAEAVAQRDLWLAALKNVRAGLMPPKEDGDDDDRPKAEEIEKFANWIKFDAFGLDPANPDPGHVTARRLNRVEYHNTIRDLMGVDFASEVEFPPDDSGHGFDNNGDVLTLSPLLLEKYLSAAETIADRAVPRVPTMMRERFASGRDFRAAQGRANGEQLPAGKAATVAKTFKVDRAEKYQVVIELEARGSFDFDPSHCKLIARIDGAERFTEDVVWHERKVFKHELDVQWAAGDHTVSFEIQPIEAEETVATTGGETKSANSSGGSGGEANAAPRQFFRSRPPTRLDVRVAGVTVRGPFDRKYWVPTPNYDRFFPKGPAPANAKARDAYATEILRSFATKAFRRPVDEAKVKALLGLARSVYTQPNRGFEEGIGRALMAVLASPRFLFRVEAPEPKFAKDRFAPVDEYALASRLSYFLWSTMPDDELFRLAARGELRANLQPQVARMLKDAKAQAFVRNFTGQWLEVRDVESVPINARAVLGAGAQPNRDGRIEFDGPLRRFMRSETEMYFDYVLREDRSVVELIDSNYTFLNERLAQQYGIPDVTGDTLRRVELPPDSVRGGVLTQGAVLAVTSNPTRTSPVKRGLFVLENILGTPPPPPPPDVPALEEAKVNVHGRQPKLSELLAVHRASKLCSSCHERMDPLGLAFENFNALGIWRDQEARQPIDAAGKLVTGEAFANVRELKHVLATERRVDFYRCLTEKMLTYALGRGVEYYDTPAVDDIVARLQREDGKISALLLGVVESPPFQKTRTQLPAVATVSLSSP